MLFFLPLPSTQTPVRPASLVLLVGRWEKKALKVSPLPHIVRG